LKYKRKGRTISDYFLFLKGEFLKKDSGGWVRWRPWSTLYMEQTPRFLAEANRIKNAELLLRPLGVITIDELRRLVIERAPRLNKFFPGPLFFTPLKYFDPNTIGSR
jgi:hypothetical protein